MGGRTWWALLKRVVCTGGGWARRGASGRTKGRWHGMNPSTGANVPTASRKPLYAHISVSCTGMVLTRAHACWLGGRGSALRFWPVTPRRCVSPIPRSLGTHHDARMHAHDPLPLRPGR